jgi:hypothetical protein
MRTVELDEQSFRRTFVSPMRNVTADAEPVIDIWPYARAIPPGELRGVRWRDGEVEHVYRTGDDRFDHVLVPTETANVYLVVVVARGAAAIHGHHILDLNEEYGLNTPSAQ